MRPSAIRPLSLAGAMIGLLLVTTAFTPAGAADMTFERALNARNEPQNWLLHHGNYQGHRFSQLKEIDTGNVKNLKIVFTAALGGGEDDFQILDVAGVDLLELREPMALVVAMMKEPVLRLVASVEGALESHIGRPGRREGGRHQQRT